ncbi:hypothetical protein CHS0354_018101 [Potamilus streckersoni]|uniref:C1q domain-containing protein n=1 Tax=Potamilus streckersoni TaxID=2493646 RepID=A0AAE0TJL3_9BIVA|nr:hypothetical protein CHS0354_018101 [Potamilus streckersoni]
MLLLVLIYCLVISCYAISVNAADLNKNIASDVISTLMKRIDSMEATIKEMERLATESGQREKAMLRRIEYLETTWSQCKTLTNEIMTRQEAMQSEIKELHNEIQDQQEETRKLVVSLSEASRDENNDVVGLDEQKDINTKMTLNRTRVVGVKRKRQQSYVRHKRANGVQVAFSAYLTHREYHLGITQVIKYDSVLINEGNFYNPLTGIFTCPEDGIYLFSFFTAAYGNHKNWVRLVVDNVNLSGATSEGTRDYHDDQGGNVAIIRLRAGQSVWMSVVHAGDAELDADSEHHHVTFSGVRLGD